MNYSEVDQIADPAEAATAAEPVAAAEPTDDYPRRPTGQDGGEDGGQDVAHESGWGANRYYYELELPLSATQDEIKSQYKQLVRLHHPDRFIDPLQKQRAEERLKSINEAYRVLSSRAIEGHLVKFMQRELGLVVQPAFLDFGLLGRRVQQTATFHVSFEKEIASVDFVPSEEDSWFRISKVSHLYGSDRAALEFEVEVDTTGLSPQTYQGWVDVYLDSTMTRVPLTMQVAYQGWHLPAVPRRWLLAGTFILAFLLFSTVLALTTGNTVPQPSLAGPGRRCPPPRLKLAPGRFTALREQDQSTIYAMPLASDRPSQRVVDGTQAAALASQKLIAYLATAADAPQLYLYNETTTETRQLTADAQAKSQLTWSPDGRYLAYLVGVAQEARIAVYDRTDDREYQLPGAITAGVSHFARSPDSTTLLFDLWRGAERRVYRMIVPDGELQQLTRFDSWGGAWSPDGQAVVVASADGLYRLDSSGRQLRQISNAAADQPQWSADGAWIAYLTAPTEGGPAALWLMHPDGSAARQVATDVVTHHWSPDSVTLGYVTGSSQPHDGLFYLWTTAPEQTAQLVAEISRPEFTWGQ